MIWPHTVTLWHKSGNCWTTQVIDHACWQDMSVSQLRRGAELTSCTAAVFLPAGAVVALGDFMVRGKQVQPVETAKDLQALGGRRVTAVQQDDFGGLSHVEVTLA